jgi:hypothetical protein
VDGYGGRVLDVFELHAGIVDEHRGFIMSFVRPRNTRIAHRVESLMESGAQWPAVPEVP